jgi:hypothetical protein
MILAGEQNTFSWRPLWPSFARMESSTPAGGKSVLRGNWLAFALLVAVTVAFRAPFLGVPFERDEGEYAYIGWRLSHGELPYRDWVDQKPPAIFWVYRGAFVLPGDPVGAVHLLATIWSAASACALYLVAKRLMRPHWAMVAAGVFAILSAHPIGEGTAANTEIFMLLPLILSVLVFLIWTEGSQSHATTVTQKPRNRGREISLMLGCGGSIGAAIAFKQVAAVNWPLLVCASPFFFPADGKRARSAVHFAIWSALGIVSVWLLIAGCFALRGGLGALIYNVLTHNLEYIHATPWADRLKLCGETLARLSRVQGIVWGFALAGVICAARARNKAHFVLLLGWLAASFAAVSASGYYFPHYFQQMLPALVIAASVAAESLAGAAWWKGVPGGFRAACVAVMIAVLPVLTWIPLARLSPAQACRRIFPMNIFAEMPQIGGEIARITRPQDRVFVFGAEAEILFYAKRVSATRYIFLFPLYGPYRDARVKQQATAREVASNSPTVVAYFPNGLFYKPGTEQFFSQWTESYLREQFLPDIYVTRDAAGAAQFTRAAAGQSEFAPPPGEQLVGIIFVRKPNTP